jgi:hypothetical protein
MMTTRTTRMRKRMTLGRRRLPLVKKQKKTEQTMTMMQRMKTRWKMQVRVMEFDPAS